MTLIYEIQHSDGDHVQYIAGLTPRESKALIKAGYRILEIYIQVELEDWLKDVVKRYA